MRSTVFPEPLRPLLLRRPPKKPIFGFGRRKKRFFGAPKNILGGRKSYFAAEHHNEAAPEKKKKRGVSAWAPKTIAPQAPAEKADFWFWAPNKKKIGGRIFLGGGSKKLFGRRRP